MTAPAVSAGHLQVAGGELILESPAPPRGHLSLEEIVRPFSVERRSLTVVDRNSEVRLGYADLATRAAAAAERLRKAGVEPGTPVAMTISNTLESILSVLGVWMAGGCVVSVPPPPRAAALQWYRSNFVPVLETIDCRHFVSAEDPADLPMPAKAVAIDSAVLTADPGERRTVPDIAIPDRALVQFTSGSIGAPKGVVIPADRLAGHLAMISDGMGVTDGEGESLVSWLPLYHDMGLVAMFLTGLYGRVDMTIAAPSTFAGKPSNWLTMLSKYRATMTAAPNFAYRLAASVPYDDGLDLSRLRVALSGGERLHWQTLLDFHAVAGPLGFRWEAIRPSYGLAEGIVGSASRPLLHGPVRGPGGHVSVGPLLPGNRARVQAGLEPTPIHLGGEWLLSGYQTAEGFQPRQGEWWDTGDAGFVHDGELYVLGRRNEVISLAGRNIFAEDVEAIGHDVGAGLVASCAAFRDSGGDHRFSVVVEGGKSLTASPEDAAELARKIRATVTELLGTRLTSVRIVRKGSIPVTTSGKVQRAQCRRLHDDGELDRRTLAELR
ncbi:fatty acyl-AMP ligase [Sphaerisporangium rubeum]|uniref:Fatty-acyl-CoA synthase n=1 Tax=Sphaerisporangium rubeum TaxID=321317 RepID=A0A7X0IIY7_9ACTN|nr:AMP-binding protein [Sphaerisporangium rubeum]MBB6475793.1 fatty-acyl-CoA synthase [Sphaerisporangium rubeum]